MHERETGIGDLFGQLLMQMTQPPSRHSPPVNPRRCMGLALNSDSHCLIAYHCDPDVAVLRDQGLQEDGLRPYVPEIVWILDKGREIQEFLVFDGDPTRTHRLTHDCPIEASSEFEC